MDPLDARIRCLEMAIDIISDAEDCIRADEVFPLADRLWSWATEGLTMVVDDDEGATRQ